VNGVVPVDGALQLNAGELVVIPVAPLAGLLRLGAPGATAGAPTHVKLHVALHGPVPAELAALTRQ
jgi:hypothetical protein